MARNATRTADQRLSGHVIVNELVRNMELGAFEMAYTILLPCVFSVYLHPEDHARLAGIFDLIVQDAKRALGARVSELNRRRRGFGLSKKPEREYRIAAREWIIEFAADSEGAVPSGDVEIHSELNETPQPGFQGTKTTLLDREPSVTAQRAMPPPADTRKREERVFAEIRYEDDSGPQLYLVKQNSVRVGRGAADEPMDVAIYACDEVSREHFTLRRDAATGLFFITDKSTNGTWVDSKRLKRDVEQPLPEQAEIGVADVLTLTFRTRR